MNFRKSIIQMILVVIILGLPVYGCAIRTMIKGQVIDAETGKPIEGAAILIDWSRPSFGIPGLSGTTPVETYETTSDTKGYFKVPKHYGFIYEYILTIYKKGYVCWNNKKVFPSHEERTDFTLKNSVVIKMERFKEEYDKLDHANFTEAFAIGRSGTGSFNDAIKEESLLLDEHARQLRKEWEERKKEK